MLRTSLLVMALATPVFAQDTRSRYPAEQLRDLHLKRGPWEPGMVHREAVLFVQEQAGNPTGKLLFDVEKVLAVHSADQKQSFLPGKDYELAADGSAASSCCPAPASPSASRPICFLPKGSPNEHRASDRPPRHEPALRRGPLLPRHASRGDLRAPQGRRGPDTSPPSPARTARTRSPSCGTRSR